MSNSFATAALLWSVATVAGTDLVSVLQGLVSRPLVAGTAAGWLLGDIEMGLRVGAALELFALDVIPVGSSRYPDFGAATVAAVWFGAGTDWLQTLGVATAIGLGLAGIAGATLPLTRRLNARVVRSYGDRLGRGDPTAVTAVHLTCLGHDFVRSGVVALGSIGAAAWLRSTGWVPDAELGTALNLAVLAGATWAVGHGAMSSGRAGPRWRWALAGLAVGIALVVAP